MLLLFYVSAWKMQQSNLTYNSDINIVFLANLSIILARSCPNEISKIMTQRALLHYIEIFHYRISYVPSYIFKHARH